jgi:AcrR family transcriptional regulator
MDFQGGCNKMQDNATLSADFDGKLTPIQERAIVSLLSHATMRTAAKAVGVDEATLWRWLQDKDFRATYRAVRRECVGQSIARLQQASTEAVNTLREIVKDKGQPAPARVSAAKAILEFSIKAVEIEDMSERLAEVEAILAQQPQKK